MNEYKINDILSVRLERDESVIYVRGDPFITCKFLLMTVPVDQFPLIDDIDSIDRASDVLDPSLEPTIDKDQKLQRNESIPPEVEFWGHCSNLQAWAENDYDTRLLHSNIAFPLLKKLTDAGDLTARKVFKEEIARRFNEGYLPVMTYLMLNNYLGYLNEQELASLAFFNEVKDIPSFISYLENFKVTTPGEYASKARFIYAIKSKEDGTRIFEEGIQKYPSNLRLREEYVNLLMSNELYSKAISHMEFLTEQAPERELFWFLRAVSEFRSGHLNEAISSYKKTIQLNPLNSQSRIGLALIYHRMNLPVARDQLIEKILGMKLHKGEVDALATLCDEMGNQKYLIRALRKQLENDPQDFEIWFALGAIYREEKNFLHARMCLKKAYRYEMDPIIRSNIANLIGLAYGDSMKIWRSVKWLEIAAKDNPENEMAWANQTPMRAGLLDLNRARIPLEISQKIKELHQYQDMGNYNLIIKLRKEISSMIKKFQSMPFKCPICHKTQPGLPKYCKKCGADLRVIEKSMH